MSHYDDCDSYDDHFSYQREKERKIEAAKEKLLDLPTEDMIKIMFQTFLDEREHNVVDLAEKYVGSPSLINNSPLKNIINKLKKSFPGSFVNSSNEFIAHKRANEYFRLEDCKSELDIKCKVLEWFSRGAYKTAPYNTNRKNEEFHEFMLAGINMFLNTNFTKEDIEPIYTYLGNCCNHEKTIAFIESGYNLSILPRKNEELIKPECEEREDL